MPSQAHMLMEWPHSVALWKVMELSEGDIQCKEIPKQGMLVL